MSEVAVAEILAAHVATSEPAAELWHRVALGQLSPDEAESQLLEGRPDVTEEERAAIERAKRVFAPLSEQQRQERLEALLARRAEESTADDEHEAVVVPMRPHRTRRWLAGLLAAAAAVVLTVWLVPPQRAWDGEAFVAGYGVEFDKATDPKRGPEQRAETPTFRLDGKIVVRVRPDVDVDGPVGVVAYVWDRSGQARRLELEFFVYASGVMELDTTVKALGLEVGEQELVVAVGWTEALPSSWEELVEAEGAGPAGFEVVRTRLRVVSRLSEGGGGE